MIYFRIRDKLFKRWIRKVQRRLPVNCNRAVRNMVDFIDTRAMQNLQSSLGTSLTGERWGHSEDISIQDSKVITDKSTPTEIRYRLEYNSPHAWIVEHGGLGKVVTSKGKPYPIGLSNFGEPLAFRESFRLQVGYNFLENAVEDPITEHYIESEGIKALKKSTRKWF